MTTINVENFDQETLRKIYVNLPSHQDWDEECQVCRLPQMLHVDADGKKKDGSCKYTKESKAVHREKWFLFREKMTTVQKWHIDRLMKQSNTKEGNQPNTERMFEVFERNMARVIENVVNNSTENNKVLVNTIVKGQKLGPTKLMKPAKVPSWSSGMKLTAYKKAIEVWMENNKDLPEAARYQEVIESLKVNKEIDGLAVYIGGYVVDILDTVEKQTVKNLIDALDRQYGRTRLEELEELMKDWIQFNSNEHVNEEQYLFAQEKLIARQNEHGVTLAEWNTIWMMYAAKQRKGIEEHQLDQLRKVIVDAQKQNETEQHVVVDAQKDFIRKYRELKIEYKRDTQVPTVEANFMKESRSRQRNRIQRDRDGSEFYQDRKYRADSRGRPYYRRYYRRDNNRSFSRGMRSVSRRRSTSPHKRNGSRSSSRSRSKSQTRKYKNCIACKCQGCEKMRKNAKELNVNWCDAEEFTINEDILVNFTEEQKQVMILDLGAPISLAGKAWVTQYLKDHELGLEDLKSWDCRQGIRFGPGKQHISTKMVELPVLVRRLDGKEEVLKVFTYLVDAKIQFLCGRRELQEKWSSRIDTKNNILETEINGEKKNFRMVRTSGNHLALEIETNNLEVEQTLFTSKDEEVNTLQGIRRVHEVNNHKSEGQLIKHYKNANMIGPDTTRLIKQVVKECKTCQQFGKSLAKPKTALPHSSTFNQVVTLDLKQFGEKYVLWCVDSFTRFVQGKLISNKQAETIIDAINECWNLPFGIPTIGYYADNGTEFRNVKMDELVSKLGISITYGPAHSPWSNGINERNHASCDITIKKLMEDRKIGLTDILVKTAAWTHNTNINRAGHTPLELVTGKAVTLPGLTMGNEATESLTDAEAVNRILETMHKVTSEFREAETKRKLKDCQGIRVRNYQNQEEYTAGDKVWYQYKNGNAWLGPAQVIYQQGSTVFIHGNGDVRKIAVCKVKPYVLEERTQKEPTGSEIEQSPELEKSPEVQESPEVEESPEVIEEVQDENEIRRDLQNDTVGAKYLQVEKSVYFMDYEVFSVEVPVKEHGKPEIIQAKNNEVENLKTYETFEEILDEGQTTIGSRWVITEKQKHDGQKQDYKARLVAQGFKEIDQPQSDSPTAAKESFKLLLALSANFGFKIVSMDIRAAFLQAKTLEREVFVRPPRDIEKPGIIWKLLKPLYGLDDASRKFYFKVKETLKAMGLKTLPGDEAVYYEHKDGKLVGLILSHVDDFTIAGSPEFVKRIVVGIKEKFTVSKVDENNFRFTGLDVKTNNGKIEVSMEDYADSIEEIKEIRIAKRDEKLTKAELKEYRKYTGKISWLAQGTRPDLSYSTLNLAKKNNNAVISDLRNVNRVVEKIKNEKNKIVYGKIGDREDLQVVGIVDASYKNEDKSVAGMMIALTNASMTKASPLMWKAKQIDRVCHSSKDAETLAMTKMIDELVYMARHVEILLYGEYRKRMSVRIITDSEPTLESIASTKQIERKALRMTVQEMKEMLRNGNISSYQWVSTKNIWADGLTKEMSMTEGMRKLLQEGRCDMVTKDINKVICKDEEIKMLNMRNRRKMDPENC